MNLGLVLFIGSLLLGSASDNNTENSEKIDISHTKKK